MATARILVIDDDCFLRNALCDALQDAGYDPVEAVDGDEGIDCFRRREVDLIITDIVMPKRGGLDVIKTLRNDFPGLRIIAISGEETSNSRLDEARELGAVRTLRKPFHLDELMTAVNDALHNAQPPVH